MKEENLKVMSVESTKIAELARNQKSWTQAIKTAMRLGNVSDKEIYIELDIDKGYFSRILSGDANLQNDKIPQFCEIVGNDLLLHWLAYQRGYELRILPKTLEEKLSAKEKEVEELKEKLSYVESLLQRVPAPYEPSIPTRFKKEAN